MFDFMKRDKEEVLDDESIRKIMLTMSHVNIPLDLMLQVVFRQQNQLFEAIESLKGAIALNEQLIGTIAENTEHLHQDVVHIQQGIESAMTHPVDKVEPKESNDEEPPEERERKRKRNMMN